MPGCGLHSRMMVKGEGEQMNRVLTSMLKAAFKNQAVFGVVLGYIADEIADRVKRDGINDTERALIDGVKVAHAAAHEFLTAVGESVQ